MELQHERDGGMISQGMGRGVSQTHDPIGCDHMSMGEPINPQLPVVLCTQSFISSRSWLRQLMPWEQQGIGV